MNALAWYSKEELFALPPTTETLELLSHMKELNIAVMVWMRVRYKVFLRCERARTEMRNGIRFIRTTHKMDTLQIEPF